MEETIDETADDEHFIDDSFSCLEEPSFYRKVGNSSIGLDKVIMMILSG